MHDVDSRPGDGRAGVPPPRLEPARERPPPPARDADERTAVRQARHLLARSRGVRRDDGHVDASLDQLRDQPAGRDLRTADGSFPGSGELADHRDADRLALGQLAAAEEPEEDPRQRRDEREVPEVARVRVHDEDEE